MDQLQIRINGGSGFNPENELYQPPSITMYKGDNQINIVLPDSINGNYILTLPQESGTILTDHSTIDNLTSDKINIS